MKGSNRWAVPAGLLLLCAGCLSGDNKPKDFLPAEQTARQALEGALTAWQNGKRFGEVEVNGLTVQPNDLRWQTGKKLTKFEIVQADPPDPSGHVWFTVKLTLVGGAAADNRFVVLGKTPQLMVFSEEAYKQASGG